METILMDELISSDMDEMGYTENMGYPGGTEESVQQESVLDNIMSSGIIIGGITVCVLALGVLFGLLSAKRKIKKGIDLYED